MYARSAYSLTCNFDWSITERNVGLNIIILCTRSPIFTSRKLRHECRVILDQKSVSGECKTRALRLHVYTMTAIVKKLERSLNVVKELTSLNALVNGSVPPCVSQHVQEAAKRIEQGWN